MFKKLLILPAAALAFACSKGDNQTAAEHQYGGASHCLSGASPSDDDEELVGRNVFFRSGLQRSCSGTSGSQAHQA